MEEKIKNNENTAPEHRKESKIILALSAIFVFLLAISVAVALILLIFPVTEIEVSGDSRYSYTEIIEASGVKKGARLYYLNERKAERKALEGLPYLESVEVNSYFPNRVKIEIKQFDEIYLLYHENGYCFVSDDFEILEVVESKSSFDEFSGIFIKLEQKLAGEIGERYEGADIDRAKELIAHLKEYGFYQYLNIVDVSKKYDMSFVINKRQQFVIGAMTDVGEKLDASFKVCFTDNFKRDANCIIDSSDKKRIVLRYVSDEIIREAFDFCEN